MYGILSTKKSESRTDNTSENGQTIFLFCVSKQRKDIEIVVHYKRCAHIYYHHTKSGTNFLDIS